MPTMEQSLVDEKKLNKESTAIKKKKRKRESEEDKRNPKSNSQECLEMEMAGAVSREEDVESTKSLAKKRKAGKGKLGGDNGFDDDFSSVGEKKAYDLNMTVDAELGQKKIKKKKKYAIKLAQLGDGENGRSICESEDKIKLDKKERKKNRMKADKDAMELEELVDGGFVMGKENGGSVCESVDKTMVNKKERKKKKKKADKDAMELEEPDNVDMGEADDGLVSESKKCSVALEEGKQVDMSMRGKKREDEKRRKESGTVAQGVGQDTLAAGNVKSGNKERKKSKTKNEADAKGKEKVAQRKDKGKRVSFTDAVEVFGDGVEDEESDEGNGSKLVHGKRFTKEEDATLMEAMMNYAQVKQLGDKGLEMIRASVKHPELKGCWDEIAKALPHRPRLAIYKRARILLYRSNARKWTEEEYEIIRRFVQKNGTNWSTLAVELGKSEIHIKDTWRRIKPINLRKGPWTQEEYQNLFDLVNLDLRVKAHQKFEHGHRLIRENISWEAISDKLTTRSNKDCCLKWYMQLSSPMVKQGVWADSDDYRLVEALHKVDAVCLEDVDWDNLLEHRSGELCRKRWNQMVRALGQHREKPFIEQVEVLARRYSVDMIDYRK